MLHTLLNSSLKKDLPTDLYFLGMLQETDIILGLSASLLSDNFSIQNNGIKKGTCRKTMGFGEKMFFFKAMFLHDFTHD